MQCMHAWILPPRVYTIVQLSHLIVIHSTDPAKSSGKICKCFKKFDLDINSLERVHYITTNKLDTATQNDVIAFTVKLLGFSLRGGANLL